LGGVLAASLKEYEQMWEASSPTYATLYRSRVSEVALLPAAPPPSLAPPPRPTPPRLGLGADAAEATAARGSDGGRRPPLMLNAELTGLGIALSRRYETAPAEGSDAAVGGLRGVQKIQEQRKAAEETHENQKMPAGESGGTPGATTEAGVLLGGEEEPCGCAAPDVAEKELQRREQAAVLLQAKSRQRSAKLECQKRRVEVDAGAKAEENRQLIAAARRGPAAAACQIQAVFRGNRTREEVAKKKVALEEKKRKIRDNLVTKNDEEKLSAAASKIQAHRRGVEVRRRHQEQRAAVTKIQAAYRGSSARVRAQQVMNERQAQAAAATKIQAKIRGKQTRSQVQAARRGTAVRNRQSSSAAAASVAV